MTEPIDLVKMTASIFGIPEAKETCPKCGHDVIEQEEVKNGAGDVTCYYQSCERCEHQWGHC